MGDAASELVTLAEYFEHTADQYTAEDRESRYLAGVCSGLRSCAQTARDRAAELGKQPGEELPVWHHKRLQMLLAALGGIRMSAAEHATVEWLASQELARVITLGALIQRARSRASAQGQQPRRRGPW
ncbi:MAG: hypothetical protein JO272_13580 [Pseudonocardiales bacterium]|nr:hypothetical protein [Pseudonocardiales bacterium]